MKTKVIHITPHLKMGGAESLIKDYALYIDKSKFEIIIITISEHTNSFNERELINSNIKIFHLGDIIPFNNNDNFFSKIIKRIKRIKLLNKIILEEKPRIIHSHLQTNDYLCFLNTKKKEIKLFHTLHSDLKILFSKSSSIYKWSTFYCVKQKNMTLISLHSRMELEAKNLFNTRNCITINNGINISRFKNNLFEKAKLKKRLDIEEDIFVVGHIGRFSKAKNHDYIIDIFKKVNNENPKTILLLVGAGELQDTIKEKVDKYGLNNAVRFLGIRQDIPEIINTMDVFLFPSLYEGYPITLIEAQAAGTRCIVSDRITKEVFLSNYITFLSLDDPVEKWCEEILNMNIIEKKSLGICNYDIKNTIKKLESTYTSFLEFPLYAE